MKEFLEKLLIVLEDEFVQKKIQEIALKKQSIYKEDNIDWENKLLVLQKENEDLKQEIEKKRNEIYLLNQNVIQIEKRREEEKIYFQTLVKDATYRLEEEKKIRKNYIEKYEKIEKYYELYLSLGKEIHKDLERVINIQSTELFFACGVQWENIETLWRYIAGKLNVFEKEKITKLCSLFDYLFSVYSKTDTKYERRQVYIGDEFDEEIHSRLGGMAAGEVKEILLLGYVNKYTGRGEKSIVIADRRK